MDIACYIEKVYVFVSFADDLLRQFGPRSDPSERSRPGLST